MKREILRVEDGAGVRRNEIIQHLFMSVQESEVYALLCSSYEEKEALQRLLCGEDAFYDGRVMIDGIRITSKKNPHLLKKYVGTVRRKSQMMESLELADNLCIKNPELYTGWVSPKKLRSYATALLRQFNISVPLMTAQEQLTVGQRVQLELLREYIGRKRIVLLDGVDVELEQDELLHVMKLIHTLQRKGMTFIWLGSCDSNIIEHADHIMLFKNHGSVRSFNGDNVTRQEITHVFFRSDMRTEYDQRHSEEEVILRCYDLKGKHLNQCNFEVRRNELVQVVYDSYEAAIELRDILTGQKQPEDGSMLLTHKPYTPKTQLDAIDTGVALIHNESFGSQLNYTTTIYDNLCFSRARRVRNMWMRPDFRRSIERMVADEIPYPLDMILDRDMPQSVKLGILYYRWLLYAPKLLVCINSFVNVNEESQTVLRHMMDKFLQRGSGVLMLNSGIVQLPEHSGRTLYLRNHTILEVHNK